MHPELLAHWETVSKLLDEALELELESKPAAREAWLAALPEEYDVVKPMLAELLAKAPHDRDALLGDALPHYDMAGDTNSAQPLHNAGDEIGGYRLIREIGQGGMGTVWLAERVVGGAGMRVALKLPHVDGASTTASSTIRERFAREREILGALNHPNISRLLDAGVSAAGQPYLAIEYVEGETLMKHCNAKALPLRERLKLFLQVLKAVEYAHVNLVIHRDLKPGNILVTPTGDVKLLDFGIAKLLAVNDIKTADTALTQQAGHVMTPDYASSEQIAGMPLTTASDVYSLGVLLFELLTGARPYRLKRGTRAELEEAILSADTSLPSAAVTQSLVTRMRVPRRRWRRILQGDLDTITLEALHKNPAQRYPSVDAFRQDIERYLDGRPVLARPESARYRFGKFVLRHKLAVGATSAVIFALLAGISVALWQARVALREANKARAVQGFLTELFEKNTRMQTDAAKARGKTVRDVLIEAGDHIGQSFSDAPELRVEITVMLANLLIEVDEFERAAKLSRDAVALMRANNLAGTDLHVEALMYLSNAARMLGNAKEALGARDEALAVLDARDDRTSLLRMRVSANSIPFLSPDPEREIQLTREALTLIEQRYPSFAGRFAVTAILAQQYLTQEQWALAEHYFRVAIALFPQSNSKDYLSFATTHGTAGYCALHLGRTEDALRDLETGIRMLSENTGENALTTRSHRGVYASALHLGGRSAEAHRLWDQLRQSAIPGEPSEADFEIALYEAEALMQEGRPRLAVERLNAQSAQYVEMGKRVYDDGVHWATLLALAHAMQGHTQEAAAALKRIDELPRQNSLPPQELIVYKMDVTWILLSTGRLDEAAAALRFGKDPTTGEPADFAEGYVNANLRAAEIAVLQGDVGLARAHSQRALDHLAQRLAPGAMPWLQAEARKVHGNVLLAAGDAAAGLQSLETAITAMRRLHDPASPWLADTLISAALAQRSLGQHEKARALLAEARKIFRQHPALSPAFTDRLRRAG